nr:DUF6614 family protein [Rhodovastum atsumiense]
MATRTGADEEAHHGMNSLVRNTQFGLTRDFPDPVRQRGEDGSERKARTPPQRRSDQDGPRWRGFSAGHVVM